MKVYKVVSVSGRWHHSTCYTAQKHQLTYKVGEWIYPRIGYIFAFDTLKNAKHFAMHTEQIWRAEVDQAWLASWVLREVTWESLERFWYRDCKEPEEIQKPPHGTLLTPRIKLLEWVWGRIP